MLVVEVKLLLLEREESSVVEEKMSSEREKESARKRRGKVEGRGKKETRFCTGHNQFTA